MIRRPPRPPPFPSPTLFRSAAATRRVLPAVLDRLPRPAQLRLGGRRDVRRPRLAEHVAQPGEQRQVVRADVGQQLRSEDHTSELQSRQYLVCRLLLEKKKQ